MNKLMYILAGNVFYTVFSAVYFCSVAYGTWLATESLLSMAGAAFITVLYQLSTVGNTINWTLEGVKADFARYYELGVLKGQLISFKETKDEDA